MCKGGSSQVAFMLYTVLALKFKINVITVMHTPGISDVMIPIDALSRGLPVSGLTASSGLVDLKGLTVINRMMDLCDPSKIRNCEDYHAAYRRAFELVEDFVVEIC